MSILLGFLGATVFSGVAAIFLFFLGIGFLPDIIIGIFVFLIFALFIGIAIVGLCITFGASDGGKFGGVIVMAIGIAGLVFLINKGDIADYMREQSEKHQTALLDNAKTFISIENLCNTEEIEMVEILFTPKMINTPTLQSYGGYNTSAYIDNVNNQRAQNKNWEQAWPSTVSSVPFEITKIPVAKNDTSFAIRLTTKDKTRTVINENYKPYFRHKVYFETKDIDPNNEALIKMVYNGSKLLIKNDNVKINEEPFFSENTIIYQGNIDKFLIINNIFISSPDSKWRRENNSKKYSNSYYNHLDNEGIPYNITMINLNPGEEFYVSFDFEAFITELPPKDSKKFIAKEFNLITIDKDGYTVTYKPNFCKFDYLK